MISKTLHLTVNELRYLHDHLPAQYKHSDDIVIVADEKRIALVEPVPPEERNPNTTTQVGKVITILPRKS